MNQMTPLAWWVLLATLFGHAMSVPARTQTHEYACVVLCRAENAAANEDKVHVIPRHQFVEGRRGREAERLLGLCLKRPQRSTICRVLVKSLLDHRRCDCELIERSTLPRRIYVSSSLLEDLVQDYSDITQTVESQLRENTDNVYRLGFEAKLKKRLPERRPMIQKEASSKDFTTGAIMDTEVRHESSASNSFESKDDVSASMETWCIAQCDIGHGGSACDCDILP